MSLSWLPYLQIVSRLGLVAPEGGQGRVPLAEEVQLAVQELVIVSQDVLNGENIIRRIIPTS